MSINILLLHYIEFKIGYRLCWKIKSLFIFYINDMPDNIHQKWGYLQIKPLHTSLSHLNAYLQDGLNKLATWKKTDNAASSRKCVVLTITKKEQIHKKSTFFTVTTKNINQEPKFFRVIITKLVLIWTTYVIKLIGQNDSFRKEIWILQTVRSRKRQPPLVYWKLNIQV